jgi:hypothetical protein
MAAIGAINFDLTSSGSDADIILAQGAGGVFMIEVSFTADASGTSGGNRGAAGMNFSINTNLPIADQGPMTLKKTLTNKPSTGVTSTNGAGFASFTDGGVAINAVGDAGKETIDSVGAFQGLSPDFSSTNLMGVVMGTMNEFVGHSGPVMMAMGQVIVDPATPAGTYLIQLNPNAAKVWAETPGSPTIDVPGIGDTLTLIIVPEPATMLLLAPAAWVLRRRRNA